MGIRAEKWPLLHVVVDSETGEHHELGECPNCKELKRELARQRTIIVRLREDKEAEAKASRYWGLAVALWQEWKIATGKIKSRWSADRFWLAEPYLRADGFVLCRWGVWGVAYEPNTKLLPSGLLEVYNTWELLFRNRTTFERYVNRGYMNPEARAQFADREKDSASSNGARPKTAKENAGGGDKNLSVRRLWDSD